MSNRKRKPIAPKSLVDVIIPVFNRFDLFRKCLDALPMAFGDIPYQVYIYDNGSEKADANPFYASLVENKNIHVTKSGQNLGFPQACNLAFKKGLSPLVFFLNSDVVLRKGSADLLVRTMDDPSVGVVGMKLLFPTVDEIQESELSDHIRPAERIQHIGIVTNIRGMLYHVFIGWTADHPRVNAVDEVMAVTGAALMTRRVLFRKVGMFWEGYGMGTFEDCDLCMAARELGFKIKVVPQAVATHYLNATGEKYKIPYPVGENYQKFVMRWKDKLGQWDIVVL